jgi:NAD(P)-dependent dehydrogenase (short-subunit alcohol dehydrogenase family)
MTPNGRVANKVALVTRAASGNGRATALLLAKEGAAVVVADIAAEAGRQVAEEISRKGGKAIFQTLDVTDETAWEGLTSRILHEFARLDVAVNDVGVAVSRPVTEMTLAEWRRVLQINLDGVFLGRSMPCA